MASNSRLCVGYPCLACKKLVEKNATGSASTQRAKSASARAGSVYTAKAALVVATVMAAVQACTMSWEDPLIHIVGALHTQVASNLPCLMVDKQHRWHVHDMYIMKTLPNLHHGQKPLPAHGILNTIQVWMIWQFVTTCDARTPPIWVLVLPQSAA